MIGKLMAIYSGASFGVRWVVRFLLLCCFLGSVSSVATCEEPFWKDRFRDELQRIIDKHPRYVWGGAESEEKGLDCSGYITLAAKRAKRPKTKRTTAINMALGKDGWDGEDIEWHESGPLDFVWWTFKPDRKHGHIGVLWYPQDGTDMVTHASMSRNRVVIDELKDKLWDDISKIRRIE